MGTSSSKQHGVCFGVFEVDFAAAVLRKRGRRVKLEAQPFQVLSVLVRRAGELITREELRDELWPKDTFVEFDHSLNTAVKKVRDALGDSPRNPRFIETIARQGYRFIAPVHPASRDVEGLNQVPLPASRRWPILLVTLALVLTAGAIGWIVSAGHVPEAPTLAAIPLTSYPGYEYAPSFSPDGAEVAFTWCRENDCGVYIKQIGVEQPFPFADGPAREISPAWSPDGSRIAFIRTSPAKGNWEIVLAPQRGGRGRVISEFSRPSGLGSVDHTRYLAWMPDGKRLIAAGADEPGGDSRLFALAAEGGAKWELTDPPGRTGDDHPSVSPDGRAVVFNRYWHGTLLLRLADDMAALGEPRQIAGFNKPGEGPAWAANGEEIFLAKGYGGLSRILPAGVAPPKRIYSPGHWIRTPAVSPRGGRFAYAAARMEENIWRLELSGAGGKAGAAKQLIASTRRDINPDYSPDGQRIAFMSDRSGSPEIWLADSDGSHPQKLTSFGGPWTAEPKWSPDGEKIAFYSKVGGGADIYVISVGEREPRRITTHPANDNAAQWSDDGKWIHFSSDRGGKRGRWKIPATGGQAVPIQPIADSEHRWGKAVADDLHPEGILAEFKDGFYYLSRPGEDGASAIRFFEFATSETKTLARTLGQSGFWSLAVSPDRRWILWCQLDSSGSDLMLLDNLR